MRGRERGERGREFEGKRERERERERGRERGKEREGWREKEREREKVYTERHLGHNISHWGLVAEFLWSEAFKNFHVNLYQTKPMRSFYSYGQLSEMSFDEMLGD